MNEISYWVNDEVTFVDALVHYANKHSLEIEFVGDIVKRSVVLKERVREDAERIKMVEKSDKARLPV